MKLASDEQSVEGLAAYLRGVIPLSRLVNLDNAMKRHLRVFGLSTLSLFVLAPVTEAQTKVEDIDSLLSRYHEHGIFNGAVLVAAGRDVIYERGFGNADLVWNVPNTPDTRFLIGSITKQFTAALVLRLAEQGLLDIQGRITDYLPEYPGATGNRITIHHLLTHTSGIPNFTRLPRFEAELKRNSFAPDSFVTVFSSLDLEFEPGSEFMYSNSGYFLLGVIVERVTGSLYAEALRDHLLAPLGLVETGYYTNRDVIDRLASAYARVPGGYERAAYFDSTIPYSAGMLYSTVRDLFTWDQALYGRGPFASPETAVRFLSPQTPFTLLGPGAPEPIIDQAVGYGVFFERIQFAADTLDAVYHDGWTGGFSTMIYRVPERGQTVIIWDNAEGPLIGLVARHLIGLLNGHSAPSPECLLQLVERQQDER
jgi:CubicO group peptidase (beta-lactamase class C family)